jgi:hypothetical protein
VKKFPLRQPARLNVLRGFRVGWGELLQPMKKFLILALAAAGVGFAAPSEAQAGGYRHRSYDDCGTRYGGREYRTYRYYDCAPRYYTYRRPVRVYRHYDYDCAPRVRYYSAPRLSFRIGF